MTEYRSLLERAATNAPPIDLELERVRLRRDRKHRNQRIAAGVVGIGAFVATVVFVTTSGTVDVGRTSTVPGGAGTGPSVTWPFEPSIAPETVGIIGLPLEGATPSQPKHGRLVVYLEGGVSSSWAAMWVYADGRVIWGDVGGIFPADAPTEGATGFVEQHLTPEGVEFLQTRILSTGLFERDLKLKLDRPGFLTIQVRNGDQPVSLTWAVAQNGIVPKDTPEATPEQQRTLERIYSLLTDPNSWPADAWADQDVETYVPSRYQVWLRVFPDGEGPNQTVGEDEVALLPAAARDILRLGTEVRHAFYELSTDDVRALAEALSAAGLEPWGPSPMGEAVLRFALENPSQTGSPLWVFVGPVLPHGEAVFLGPG